MKMGGMIAALASGTILAVSRDTGHLGFLVLVGPVPLLLHVLGERRVLNTFVLAYLVGLMAEAGPLYFYGGIIPMVYGIVALQALFFALSVLLMWTLYPRSPTLAVFAYAAATGAIELLYSYVSPNGSFGALGYALVDVLPLLQIASLAGVAGLSFLAAIIPAGIATLIRRPTDYLATSAWILPVLAALLFGFWRLAQPDGEAIRVALLSNDEFAGVATDEPDRNEAIVANFRQNIEQVASQRPAYIVTPEKMFLPTPEFARLSVKLNTRIVAGIDRPLGNGQRSNTAELTRPDLSALTYDKHYLIPGLEGEYVPGKDLVSVDRIGIAICKDMDFPRFLRTYRSRHIGLLLVPAWDFVSDAKLHGKMAIVRGVENGFAVARTASHGLLTLSDSRGRVIAEASSAKGQGNLVGAVPLGTGDTFYASNGDAFGWSLVIVCGGFLFALLVVKIEPHR
jgi:apolipoprotein N-acyltransferase